MRIKTHFTILILLSVLVNVPPVFAKPLSEPTTNNKAELTRHFETLVNKHADELQLFRDVDFYHPDYGVIAYFKRRGIVQGVDGFLHPSHPITRAEFAKIFSLIKSTAPLEQALERPFPDVATNAWYARAVKFAKETGAIKGFPDGEFKPERNITTFEIKKILGFPNIPEVDKSHIATRVDALKLIYMAFPYDRRYATQTFENVNLSVNTKEILNNGQPIRGILVNFVTPVDGFSDEKLHQEFSKIYTLGIRGISIEIGWATLEPKDDQFVFPAYYDRLLHIAKEEGLWVDMLFSPHYTPRWLFTKYRDIYLYDNNGKKVVIDNVDKAVVPEGAYLTFSPNAVPAVQEQIHWQQEAVKHYSQYPNILSFFLTNEQTFDKDQLIDYSAWSLSAWKEWLKTVDLPTVTAMPVDPSDPNFFAFQRFRQDTLTHYFNLVFNEVSKARSRFIPLAHKTLFYESTAAFATHYGLRPSGIELNGDIVANDIYGYAGNVYAAQASFKKPIFLVETNLTGSWSGEDMYQYLIAQYLQGAAIQSVFRWNPGSDGNTLFDQYGNPRDKLKGVIHAAMVINNLEKTLPTQPPNFGIIAPLTSLSTNSYNYEAHQYSLDTLHDLGESLPDMVPSLLWSDNISVENYYKQPWREATYNVNEYQIIAAPITSLDAQAVNNAKVRDWVASGGTLLLEPENSSLPNWITHEPGQSEVKFGKGKVMYCAFEKCLR